MSVVLLVITDGRRDYLEQTIDSARSNLLGDIAHGVMYDDTGDADHRRWLAEHFPDFEHIHHPAGRQGFGGAIRTAWAHIALRPEQYVFHLEQDFTFNRPVPLDDMTEVLADHDYLVQMALRRQPWNPAEQAAGGIVELHPHDFIDRTDGRHHWLEHRRFFTTNPSLYRRTLCNQPWPRSDQSEGRFTHQLLASPKVRFGFWGARESGEAVTHIGHQRVGVGY